VLRHALGARWHRAEDLRIAAGRARRHAAGARGDPGSTPMSRARSRALHPRSPRETGVPVTRLAHGVPLGGELDYLTKARCRRRSPAQAAQGRMDHSPMSGGATGPAPESRSPPPRLDSSRFRYCARHRPQIVDGLFPGSRACRACARGSSRLLTELASLAKLSARLIPLPTVGRDRAHAEAVISRARSLDDCCWFSAWRISPISTEASEIAQWSRRPGRNDPAIAALAMNSGSARNNFSSAARSADT